MPPSACLRMRLRAVEGHADSGVLGATVTKGGSQGTRTDQDSLSCAVARPSQPWLPLNNAPIVSHATPPTPNPQRADRGPGAAGGNEAGGGGGGAPVPTTPATWRPWARASAALSNALVVGLGRPVTGHMKPLCDTSGARGRSETQKKEKVQLSGAISECLTNHVAAGFAQAARQTCAGVRPHRHTRRATCSARQHWRHPEPETPSAHARRAERGQPLLHLARAPVQLAQRAQLVV